MPKLPSFTPAPQCHVVVRQQGQPLVDCLASFAAAAPRCDLLVFGSMALTVAPTDPWPMCSVSLALLKATLRPALVVKANAGLTGTVDWERDRCAPPCTCAAPLQCDVFKLVQLVEWLDAKLITLRSVSW